MRTQVGIIGAGPAGLFLANLLQRRGIDCVVLESRSRDYVEARIRAGVLEQGTVDLMDEMGLGARMHKEGLLHDGTKIRFNDATHRIDFRALAGRAVMVYAQHEVVKDLIAARLAAGAEILFETEVLSVEDPASKAPFIRFKGKDGAVQRLDCDFVAGCDGFHGVARGAIPAEKLQNFEREYPFAWLGLLAEAPPCSEELIYANHPRGFALFSMRSPTVTRAYVQVPPEEDADNWSDQRLWDELEARLESSDAEKLIRGPILQKGVTAMRSFVTEPMQYGCLFLAGDAAHIVPPTGAKGLNLAAHDVYVLAQGITDFYANGSTTGLDRYSDVALKRIWRAQHFSWWMTSMLHKFPAVSAYDARRQLAELDAIVSSEAGSRFLAENYAGLPFG